MTITLNLTPKACEYWNLRRIITKAEWAMLAGEVRRRAGYKCESCGRPAIKGQIVCHEEWKWEDGFQRLDKMMALCRSCHVIKHGDLIGHRMTRLQALNFWTNAELRAHVESARDVLFLRETQEWAVDTKQILAKAREYLPRKREVFGSFRRGMSKTL